MKINIQSELLTPNQRKKQSCKNYQKQKYASIFRKDYVTKKIDVITIQQKFYRKSGFCKRGFKCKFAHNLTKKLPNESNIFTKKHLIFLYQEGSHENLITEENTESEKLSSNTKHHLPSNQKHYTTKRLYNGKVYAKLYTSHSFW